MTPELEFRFLKWTSTYRISSLARRATVVGVLSGQVTPGADPRSGNINDVQATSGVGSRIRVTRCTIFRLGVDVMSGGVPDLFSVGFVRFGNDLTGNSHHHGIRGNL